MAPTIMAKGFTAESPAARGIREFLSFCRMEKGLSRNSLDAYGRDLAALRTYIDPLTGGELPDTQVLKSYHPQP